MQNKYFTEIDSRFISEMKKAGFHAALGSAYYMIMRRDNWYVLLLRNDDDTYSQTTISKSVFKDAMMRERRRIFDQ